MICMFCLNKNNNSGNKKKEFLKMFINVCGVVKSISYWIIFCV